MSGAALPPVIVELKAITGKFTAGMKEAGAELDALGTRGSRNLNKLSAAAGLASKATVIAGVAVAAEGVKLAADFQKNITLLHTAGGESVANLKIDAAGIKQIAMGTGTSLNQLTEGMYTVEKAGLRGANGLTVLKAAAEGAKAENVDLGVATNALTSLMMSYHLSAGQATKAENELVAGAGAAKTTMQEYAGSLSTVLPVASAANISFDQVAGAIATLTQHGTSAQESTQELSNTIRGLEAPNQVAQKAMQQLGLDVVDVETKLGSRGLTGTIDLITNAIASKLGPAGTVVVNAWKQSASASEDLQIMLGKMPPQLAALSKSFENGSLSYKDYYQDIKSFGGTSYVTGMQFLSLAKQTQGFNDLLKSGQPAAQTFAAELKQIMGGATGMNTALMLSGANSKYFQQATEEVAKAGQHAGSNITTWADTQHNLSVQLAQAKEMVEVLAEDIGEKLIPYVAAATSWFVQHKQVALDLAEALAITAAALTAVKIAMIAWTGAAKIAAVASALLTGDMEALDAAMAANPFGAIIIAAIALGTGLVILYQRSQTFRDIVTGAFHAVAAAFDFAKEHADAVGLALMVLGGPILTLVGAGLLLWRNWNTIWTDIKTVTASAVTYVKSIFGSLTAFWSEHSRQIEQLTRAAWVLISTYVKVGIDLIVAVIRPAITMIEAIFRTGWDIVKDVVTTALRIVADVVRTGVQTTLDILGIVIDLLTGRWGKAWNDAKKLVADAFHGIAQIFTDFASGALHLLYDVGRDIIQGLVNGIKSMAGAAVDAVKHVGGDIVGGAKKLLAIFSPSRVMADEVGQPISTGIAQGILAGGPTAVGAAEKVVSSVASALRVGLQHTLGSKAGAFATANGVTVTQNLTDSLTSGLASSMADMQKIGSQIPASVGSGISGGSGSATKATKDLANRIKTILGQIGSSASPQINVSSTGIALVEKQLKHAGKALDEAVKHGLSASQAAPLRAELKKLTEQANNQLTRLKAKIDTTDLKNLTKSLTGSVSDMQSAMNQLITDEKKAGAPQKVIDALKVSEQQLTAAMREQTKVADRLATAKQNLANLEQSYKDQVTQVTQALLQQADIGQMGSVTDAQGNTSVTLQAILDQYHQQAQTDQDFMDQVKQLQGEGLNSTTVQQLIADGPAQAAQQVKLLASATKDQIAQINADTKSITTSGTGLGTLSASDMYSSGINAARSLVSGLQAQQKDLQSTIKTLANGVKTLDPKDMQKEGVDAAKGLIKGLESQKGALVTAIRKIGEQMLAAFKESLDIHSPSRLMADAVGAPVVLGVVKGMADTTPAAVQAARAVTGTVVRASVQQLEATTPAGPARAGAAGGLSVLQPVTVTIQGNASEQDAHAIAQQIQAAIAQNNAALVRELTAAGGR